MITGNQKYIKKMNKSLVLNTIKNHSPISRAKIAEMLQLNKSTVSSLVSELIDEEITIEVGQGTSSGGRRPVLLLFNNRAGFSIGINIEVNFIHGVLTDLNGDILLEKELTIEERDFDVVFEKVKILINSLITQCPKSKYGIIGIGVGVPGIVNETGVILLAPNLKWKSIQFKEKLEDEYNIPVLIENEANAGAIGERYFGAGINSPNMIYISAGTGIGTGIIINDELFKGAGGFSGEMGHFIIETNGRSCSCGSRGCWELYASQKAIIRELKNPSLTFNKVINLLKNGDNDSIRALNSVGEYLGIGISNIINTFNPDTIIIGNRMAHFERWLSNPIKRVIQEKALSFNQDDFKLKFSPLPQYSTVLGITHIVTNKYFYQPSVLTK